MKYIDIDGIGPVLLERSDRARRLVISVRRDQGVRVAVPRRVSFRKAEMFARAKVDWVRKQLDAVSGTERECRSLLEKLEQIKKSDARRALIERLDKLAVTHGFAYNRVSIRNQRTRWGSCSHRGNISLNMKLTLLPDDLMDYVILHELVHTRVKNHSQAFWDELGKYVKEPKRKASNLRKYGLVLL